MTRAIFLQFLSLFLILVFSNCSSSTNNKSAKVINAKNKSLRKTKDLGQVGLSGKVEKSKEKTAPIPTEPSLLKINDPSNMTPNNSQAARACGPCLLVSTAVLILLFSQKCRVSAAPGNANNPFSISFSKTGLSKKITTFLK